jgi:hypothetical protein
MPPSQRRATNVRVTARTGERLLRIAAEIQLIRKRLASAGLHDEAQACALVRSDLEKVGNKIIATMTAAAASS